MHGRHLAVEHLPIQFLPSTDQEPRLERRHDIAHRGLFQTRVGGQKIDAVTATLPSRECGQDGFQTRGINPIDSGGQNRAVALFEGLAGHMHGIRQDVGRLPAPR